MPDNSRLQKRSRQKLEPISIAELAGDSTMTGFSDLFKIPTAPQQSAASPSRWKRPSQIADGDPLLRSLLKAEPPETDPPVLSSMPSVMATHQARTAIVETDRLDTGPSETDPPGLTAPLETVISKATSAGMDVSRLKTPPVETGPFETGPLEARALDTGRIVPAILPRKLQVREARYVQDGHTYGEQRVYEALWDHGNIVNANERLITIGFLKMSSVAKLAESNCKAAVAGLIDKQAIERVGEASLSYGRTYRVYSWSAVLERRRKLGLVYVVKSRGVVFVDKNGAPLTTTKTPPRGGRTQTSGVETSGPVSRGPVSADQNNSAITDLAARLRSDVDRAFDDSAAGRLWRECRKVVSDCTIDEIMYFVNLKARRLTRDRKVANPIGLLLMTVPDFFIGSAVNELREQKSREDQEARETHERLQNYWKGIADDPATTPQERELARRFTAQMGEKGSDIRG